MAIHEHRTSDEALLRRVRGEYLEMPGLRLSGEQAQRLWALDAPTCDKLLSLLLETGFLQRGSDARYGRMSESLVRHPAARIAKAQLEPTRVVEQQVPFARHTK